MSLTTLKQVPLLVIKSFLNRENTGGEVAFGPSVGLWAEVLSPALPLGGGATHVSNGPPSLIGASFLEYKVSNEHT